MFSSQIKVLVWVCFLLIMPTLLAGCSKKEAGIVQGRVTLNGKPMTTGRIEFTNAKNNIAMNVNINEDGTYVAESYDMKGLPPGEYQVAVYGSPISSEDLPLGDPVMGEVNLPKPASVPKKYQNPATSELKAIVQDGENKPFNYDLK